MDKTLKKKLDKLTEQDLFMNEDVRLTYIDNVVRKLKQGIYPTSNLKRLDSLIKRHNRIKEMKKDLKKRGQFLSLRGGIIPLYWYHLAFLEDLAGGQLNFDSKSAREIITKNIVHELQTKGDYHQYDDSEIENQLAQEDWVCSICNKNTYHIDWDYIGSNTNHLQCELELESMEKEINETPNDMKLGGKVRAIKDQIYREITSDGLPPGGDVQAVLESQKLAEEIVNAQKGSWIYESPDGGKTVFRRPAGSYDSKDKVEIDWETKEPTGRVFSDYNNGNWKGDEGQVCLLQNRQYL